VKYKIVHTARMVTLDKLEIS